MRDANPAIKPSIPPALIKIIVFFLMGCNQPIDLDDFNSNLRSLSVCSDADILLSSVCRSIIEELICDTTRLISASIRDVSMGGDCLYFLASILTTATVLLLRYLL